MKRRNNYPPPRKPTTAGSSRRNIIPSSFSPSTRATGSSNLTRFIFFAGAYLVASTLLLVGYLYVIPIPTSLPIFEKEVTVEWWHARQFLRDFVGLPEEHNTTVDGFSIPGPFYQDKLYLVGARLTTSFEANNDNVYATLFMMPGDFWHRKKADKIRCAVNALSNGDNGTLLSHNKVIETLKIYVEVTGCLTCGGPIAMEYIPSIHADANVVNVTNSTFNRIIISTMIRALTIALLSLDAATAFVHPHSAPQLGTPTRLEAHDRRELLASCAATLIGSSILPQFVSAVMTDETLSYATPSLDSSYTQQSPNEPVSLASVSSAAPTDEITFTITKSDLQNMKGLGLELGEVDFRTNFRVVVKSVTANSLAERIGIKKGWIVVSVNGADGERTDASGVATYFSRAVKSVLNEPDDSDEAKMYLTFRDPSVFRSDLKNLTPDKQVSTKVAPAGDTTQRYADGTLRPGASVTEQQDQVVSVSQLIAPKFCTRKATTDDLLEISYIGTVQDTGAIFDGSAVKINGEAVPGRGNDISIFFVLGKQPFGQFPPGWDVGLEGMCIGERRRLIIPPVLGYGAVGVPRRGIPPNATLQYDVTLVSLNGLATP